MKIFLDTANMEEIIKYNKMGLLDGITTNPTLLSKETGMNPQEVMKDIAKLIKGDVSLEVIMNQLCQLRALRRLDLTLQALKAHFHMRFAYHLGVLSSYRILP